jgi:hypothetical protein
MQPTHLRRADVQMLVDALRDRAANARRSATGWMPDRVTNKEAVAAIFLRQAQHAAQLAALLEGADVDVWSP